MTKKNINDLGLEYNDPVVIEFNSRRRIGGYFRLFNEYFIFVDKNRKGYSIDPKDLRRIRKVPNNKEKYNGKDINVTRKD